MHLCDCLGGVGTLIGRLAVSVGIALLLVVAVARAPQAIEAQVPGTVNADEDGSGDISAGDTLSYQISATNSGGVSLTNVVVSDVLSGDTNRCSVLAPGSKCVLAATYV